MGRATGDDIGEGSLKVVDKLFVGFLRTSPISVSSISVEAGEGGEEEEKSVKKVNAGWYQHLKATYLLRNIVGDSGHRDERQMGRK